MFAPEAVIKEPEKPVRPATPPKIGWPCPSCTVINEPYRPGCEVCGTTRPDDYQPPPDYKPTKEEEKFLQEDRGLEEVIILPSSLNHNNVHSCLLSLLCTVCGKILEWENFCTFPIFYSIVNLFL